MFEIGVAPRVVTLPPPARNWAASLLVGIGIICVATVIVDGIAQSLPGDHAGLTAVLFVLGAAELFVIPLAVCGAFVGLSVRSNGLVSLVRGAPIGAICLIAAPLCAFAGITSYLIESVSTVSAGLEPDFALAFTLIGVSVALSVVAGILVVRANVASGPARWSGILFAVLGAMSVAAVLLELTNDEWGRIGAWGALPLSVGILFFGLTNLRTGLVTRTRTTSSPERLLG